MTVKSVSFTIVSNGLGSTPAGGGQIMCVIGVSSAGTINQPFESTAPGDFVTNFGYGPAVECAGYIAQHSGNPVLFVKAATATPGTNTAVTIGTGNTSSSAVTITGTPLDTYEALVTILTGGVQGVSGITATVSLDAGRSVYSTVNLGAAVSYVIPNTGLTVNFGSGTLIAGDTFRWLSFEPTWSDATVQSAFQGLLASTSPFKNVVITGHSAASDASAWDTQATNLFNKKRFTRILCAARDALWGGTSTETAAAWEASIIADFAAFSSERVLVSAGEYNVPSANTSTQYRRPFNWVAGAIDAVATVGQDISAVAPNGSPVPVPMLAPPAVSDGFIYYDAQQNPILDSARFMTAQRLFGIPGMFMTNSNIMSSPGDDFSILPYGEVIDEACFLAYVFFVSFLGGSVRVNAANGNILEADAQSIEKRATKYEQNGLGNGVSAVGVTVNRANNILSTKTLLATVSVVPLGYINAVNITMTLTNPSIVVVGG